MVGDLAIAQGAADLAGAARAVASMPEDDLTGVEARPGPTRRCRMKLAVGNQVCLRPLFCAFLAPKRFRAGALSRAQTPDRIPTTPDLRTAPAGRQPEPRCASFAHGFEN